MLIKVRMMLESIQYDPEEPFAGETGEREAAEPTHMIEHMDGRLRIGKEEICLTYDEPQEDAGERVQVQLSFRRDEPQTVMLTRSGGQRYSLIFCEGRRSVSDYELGGFCAELVVYTRRMRNTLASDGRLHLEYSLELQGCNNGRRVIDIRLEPYTAQLREY